jgi:hypothetical protein
VVSRSSGQVAHVLLTRSPLGLHWCCHQMDLVRLACVKHAASVRPEPGSNSPSRPPPRLLAMMKIGEPVPRHRIAADLLRRLAQHGLLSVQCNYYGSIRKRLRARGSPALAFGYHYSVFKERQAHTKRRWCRCPGRGVLPVNLGPLIVGPARRSVKGDLGSERIPWAKGGQGSRGI